MRLAPPPLPPPLPPPPPPPQQQQQQSQPQHDDQRARLLQGVGTVGSLNLAARAGVEHPRFVLDAESIGLGHAGGMDGGGGGGGGSGGSGGGVGGGFQGVVSARGIELALEYYNGGGGMSNALSGTAVAFLPHVYLDPLAGRADDAALMAALAAQQLLFACPATLCDERAAGDGRGFQSMLRRFALQDGAADACVVSNDAAGSRFASVPTVPFLFIGDEFLPMD